MWAAGYSLDNLSLMALTIAVGFVVDDAIVVLENITRHVEARHEADPRGAEGRRRDRLHRGVDLDVADRGADPAAVDERHHRPPVPRILGDAGDDDRGFGGRVADLDADDGLAVPARPHPRPPQQDLHVVRARIRRDGQGLRARPRRGVAPPLHHLDGLSRHPRRHRRSVRRHSQRLLPAAGHRRPVRHLRRAAGHLLCRDDEAPGGARRVVQADPDVANVAMALGAGVGNSAQNSGRMFITLKPREERTADAFQIIARLRPKLAQVQGRAALSAGGAGRHRRRALRAHPVPVHAAGRQSRRVERLGAEDPRQAREPAGAARRRHRPAERRHDPDPRRSIATWRRASASSRN